MPAIGTAVAGLLTAFKATAIGSFLTTHWLGRLLASTALTALQAALTPRPPTPGISTEYTLNGDTNPCGFVLGTYATAGDMVCPPMSHGSVGGTPNAFLTYVIALSDVPGQGLRRVIIDGEYVTLGSTAHAEFGLPVEGRLADRAWVKFYDGTQSAADPMLLAKYGSYPERPWSADMIGRNTCYAILTFQYDRERFSGMPVCRFELTSIPLYDPRKDSTVGGSGTHRWANKTTWQPSINPMVQVYNLLRGVDLPNLGIYGGQVEAADLPLDVWFAAMNPCDVVTTGSAPFFGGYPTWAAGIEVRVDREPASIIEELLKAATAQLVDNAGIWKPRVGPPGLPVLFITDDDQIVTRPQDRDPFPPADQRFNGVAASYPEPSALWEVKTAPPRHYPAWEIEDGGRRMASLQLPAVTNAGQVQRIMEALARDERRHLRHGFTLPPMAAILEPLDTISWTSAWRGYTGKLFEVGEIADDLTSMLQQVAVRECDSADWNWNSGLELPVAIPSPVSVYPAALSVPGFDLLAHDIADGTGAPRRSALRLVWTSGGMTGFRGIEFEVRVAATGAIIARFSLSDVTSGEVVLSEGVLAGTAYEARSRPIVDRPVIWSAWEPVTTGPARLSQADLAPALVAEIAKGQTALVAHDALVAGPVADIQREVEARRNGTVFSFLGGGAASDWQVLTGTDTPVLVAAGGAAPKVLQLGNNVVLDRMWVAHKTLIPFDTTKTYKTTVKARRGLGSGAGFWVGFAGVAADGVTLVNNTGGSSVTQFFYHAANSATPGTVLSDFVGYTAGRGVTTGTTAVGTKAVPGTVHPNVAFLRPLIIANDAGLAGITEIASFVVEDAALADVMANVATLHYTKTEDLAREATAATLVETKIKQDRVFFDRGDPDFREGLLGWASSYLNADPLALTAPAYSGSLAETRASTDAGSVGKDLVIKGYIPLYTRRIWAVDPARTYRLRFRVKIEANPNSTRIYMGFMCMNVDGSAAVGSNAGHRYTAFPILAAGGFIEYTATITGTAVDSASAFEPGTRAIRLLFLANYSNTNQANITAISWASIEDITPEAALNASVSNILSTRSDLLAGTAFAALLTQLQVSTSTGLSAWATTQATAITTLQGQSSAQYAFRVGAGGASAGLKLQASTAPGVDVSSVQIDGDTINLKGKVTADSLTITPSNMVANADFLHGERDWRKWGLPAQQVVRPRSYFSGGLIPAVANAMEFTFLAGVGTTQEVTAFTGAKAYTDADAALSMIRVTAGWPYRIRVSAACSHVPFATFWDDASVRAYWLLADGTFGTYDTPITLTGTINGSFQEFTGTLTPPVNAVGCWLYVTTQAKASQAAQRSIVWHSLHMSPMVGADLVVEGSISAVSLAAGAVTTDKLAVGAVHANNMTIDNILNLNSSTAALTAGKASPGATSDGVAFGRFGGDFGFAASRTAGGKRQELKITPESGLRVSNATFRVSAPAIPVEYSVLATGTVTLPAGTKSISLTIQGGGAGGNGHNGAVVSGVAGGLTRVELHHNGVATGIFWQVAGGASTSLASGFVRGDGQASPQGAGGLGAYTYTTGGGP